MAPKLPQKFGSYTLHELIARGGMAEIYRATMPGIGGFEKTVAIKKILPHLAENEEFITMLIDEARIIVSIDHYNIAQVYDLGRIDDSYYIAMEYIHGPDLSDVIKGMARRNQYVPIPHAIYIGSCICAGLHVAHAKTDEQGNPLNIVHRDVSPHNVLLSYAGDVKIIDFGVAKASTKETHTKMGVIKGKLLYMAPEQAKAEDIDGRSDLFAAGLIIYKMVTNQLPFQGENEFQIYNNILNKQITPPKILNPDVPDAFNDVIMKLLARNPDDRYQDGYAAKQDLDRALHQIAPGYTVNRLSRFIDENFAQQQRAGSQAQLGSGPAPAPQTPSANHVHTGQNEPVEIEPMPFDPDDTADTVNMRSDRIRESVDHNSPLPPGPPGAAPPQQRRATVDADDTGEFNIPGPPPGLNVAPAMQGGAAKTKKGIPAPAIAAAVMGIVVAALVALVVIMQEDDDSESQAPVDAVVDSDRAPIAEPEEPTVFQVVIDSIPDGAIVYENGDLTGITPIELDLEGSDVPIEFELRKDGFEPLSFSLTVHSHEEHVFELTPLDEAEADDEADENGDARAEADARESQPSPEPRQERPQPRPEPQPEPQPEPEPAPAPPPPPPPEPEPADDDDDDGLFDPFG